MESEWQGNMQEVKHRQQKHRTGPQILSSSLGCMGPDFLSPRLEESQGRKETWAPDPCTCCSQAHKHFPRPSGTRPHFVFTHNQFLIKFDFSSHLFRRPVPLGSGEHESGARLAVRESKQSRALPSAHVGKGSGLKTGFCLENCSHRGSLFGEISLPRPLTSDASSPGAKEGSQV